MRFTNPKRRRPPTVIIVSLIDVLLVVLIFLMVTTTFRQQPALKLALPESRQSKPGVTDAPPLVVTIDKKEPHLYLGTLPVTMDKLESELRERAAKDPQLSLAIRADTDAPFGQIIKVMDAAKAAQIRSVDAFMRNAPAN